MFCRLYELTNNNRDTFSKLQTISKNFSTSMFVYAVTGILLVLSNIFICCFLGKLATESYSKMAVALYNCNWHELTLSEQKYFIVMLGNAQRPLNYTGYGLVTLDLEKFSSVSKS